MCRKFSAKLWLIFKVVFKCVLIKAKFVTPIFWRKWIKVVDIIEVCTGQGLHRGPYPDRAVRCEVIYPTGRAGPANEGWFFRRAGPGRQMRDDFSDGPGRAGTWQVIFLTGLAGPAKREMSFLTAGSGYKKRKTNNITSQFELRKQRRSFETDR